MHFADFVVSYSLQANTRCLRYLAETDASAARAADAGLFAEFSDELSRDAHTVYSENLLAREARKLSSLWALVAGVIPAADEALLSHIRILRQAAGQLSESSSSRRLALRLASVAVDERDAQAMLFAARRLPAHPQLDWDELNELFTADSRFWRDRPIIRTLADDAIVRRISKSYRKVYRSTRKLAERENLHWQTKEGARLTRWSHTAAHQLELLRDSLSDKGRTRLWFLEKLADSLRNLVGLQNLRAQIQALPPEDVEVVATEDRQAESLLIEDAQTEDAQTEDPQSADPVIGVGYVEQQISTMEKRIVRLAQKGFKTKPKRMQAIVEQAIAGSGLRQVSLVAPEQKPAAQGMERADGEA